MKKYRAAGRVAMVVLCTLNAMPLVAQDVFARYVSALSKDDAAQMRSLVALNDRELTTDFFEMLRLTAEKLDTDNETAAKSLIVASSLARNFADTYGSSPYRAIEASTTV